MTSRIVPHRDFRLAEQPENRLLEKLSDRGIDMEKLTLMVLLDALEAAGVKVGKTPSESAQLMRAILGR